MWGKSIRYLILGEGGMTFNYGKRGNQSFNYMGREYQSFNYVEGVPVI